MALKLLNKATLPKSYPQGAKKAYKKFQQFYGSVEGRRIFFQKAEEQGTGNTLRKKVSSVYAKGAHPKGSGKN